jgi:lipopolysaccharide/colanic/teichoic acid biosynthesis glycosyltransferase
MFDTIDASPATDALAQPVRARNSWQRWSYLIAKRLIDIVASFLLLILLLPLFAAVAIWIMRDSPGPVLFRQTRLGRNGKPFTVYKFRSMLAGADEAVHREYFLRLLGTAGSPQAATVFKVPNDQRVTRVGAILRQTSIDELPQLWNVLTGTMSLVGPRPPIPYEVEAYEPWMRQRLEVLPGITGLWQVSGRSRLNVDEMFRLDVEYVRRRSLGLDLKILLLTVPTVLAAGKAA